MQSSHAASSSDTSPFSSAAAKKRLQFSSLPSLRRLPSSMKYDVLSGCEGGGLLAGKTVKNFIDDGHRVRKRHFTNRNICDGVL